jgi:hypothetical protein
VVETEALFTRQHWRGSSYSNLLDIELEEKSGSDSNQLQGDDSNCESFEDSDYSMSNNDELDDTHMILDEGVYIKQKRRSTTFRYEAKNEQSDPSTLKTLPKTNAATKSGLKHLHHYCKKEPRLKYLESWMRDILKLLPNI